MNATTHDLGTLLLRLALGVLFVCHALLKLIVFTLPGTVAFFEQVGLPGALVYPVVAVELVGGALLIAGVSVRPTALALAAISFGAIIAHAGNGWVFSNAGGGWEYPLFLGVVSAAQALLGSGRIAIRASGSAAPRALGAAA